MFAVDGFTGAQATKKYPTFIRPLKSVLDAQALPIQPPSCHGQAGIVPDPRGLKWMPDNAQREDTGRYATTDLRSKIGAKHGLRVHNQSMKVQVIDSG